MKKYTIFYVDDNVDYADIFFETHNTYFDIKIYHNANSVIPELKKNQPDLLILDVHMPQKSGLELFQDIKLVPELVNVPIMFLSADATDETVLSHLKLMPEDFLFKADSPELVKARIFNRMNSLKSRQAFSANSQKSSEDLIEYSNLVMDNRLFKVSINNTNINLTNIEYRMLFFILTNVDNSLLKADLVEFVWGGSYVVGRTVNTHLSNLRSKIAEASFAIKVNRTGDHIKVVPKTNTL